MCIYNYVTFVDSIRLHMSNVARVCVFMHVYACLTISLSAPFLHFHTCELCYHGVASFPGLSRFYVRLVHAKHEREEKFEFFLALVFRVYQAHVKTGKAWERG